MNLSVPASVLGRVNSSVWVRLRLTVIAPAFTGSMYVLVTDSLGNSTLRYPVTVRTDTKYGFTVALPNIQLNVWNGDTVQLPSRYLIATVKELDSQLWTISGFGFITLDSFEDGNNLTLPNKFLHRKAIGEYYRWDGALPKSVPAGSTPQTTVGVSPGSWLSVGDAALRTQISDPDGATTYPQL